MYTFVIVYESREVGQPSPYSIARHNAKEWEMLADDVGCYSDLYWDIDSYSITHWMPLPEKPVPAQCENGKV